MEEKLWLAGDVLGWQGPWGTTYPPNLRLYMQNLSEEQWLQTVRNLETRPPMPWFALRQMPDADLRAIYQFIRSLGPTGEPAPVYLPPGTEPTTPVLRLVVPAGEAAPQAAAAH